MKYLVTFRRRDGVPVPPDRVAALLGAQRHWLQEKIDDGTFDCAHVFAQGSGGVAVVNADSAEELSETIASAPAFVLTAIEVQPLAPADTLEIHVRALERLLETAA